MAGLFAAAPDPTPASKVVFVWNNRLFCGRRRGGGLDFPGGKAEATETPSECARRELREETSLGSHAAASLDSDAFRAPQAVFDMHLDDKRYSVSLFVVPLALPDVALTAEGSRELASPAWRELPEVVADLTWSRSPVAAGRAYAAALLVALLRAKRAG